MVTKKDWKTKEMPEKNTTYEIELPLTEENREWLQKGHIPTCMEDKWFTYYENNKYYFHRSWTGYCIFIVEEKDNNIFKVTANRNEEQYTETNNEKEKERVIELIKHFARIN